MYKLAEIKYYFNLCLVPFEVMAVISYIHNAFHTRLVDMDFGMLTDKVKSPLSELCNIHRIYTVHLEGIKSWFIFRHSFIN